MSPATATPSFRVRDQHALDVNGRHYRMVVDSAMVVETGHVPRRILDVLQAHAANGNGNGNGHHAGGNGHGDPAQVKVPGLRAERPAVSATDVAEALRGEVPEHVVREALLECVAMDLIEPVDENGVSLQPSGIPAELPEEPPPGLGMMGSLTLHVAHACNMKCGYCYADFGLYGGPSGMMSQERAQEYIDGLFASCGDNPDLSIQFFGGEPLLNYPVIQWATEYAIAKGKEHGKRMKFGMTTNALLLDREKAEFLSRRGFTLTVSIDGPKDTNDRIRPTNSGAGTYDRIVSKVPLLRMFPRSAARVTVTRKDLDVERIVTHLVDAGFSEVGVSNVTTANPEWALQEEDYAVLLAGFRRLTERFVDDAMQGRLFPFSNIRNLLTQIHEGTARTHPCGAGIRLFAGTPEGGLYLCHRFAGQEDFRLGDAETGIDTKKQESMLRALDVRKKLECETCWLRTLCAGGCHHVSHEQAGDACGVDPVMCPWLREWFHTGFETYVRLSQDAPEFLSRILGERSDCFQT